MVAVMVCGNGTGSGCDDYDYFRSVTKSYAVTAAAATAVVASTSLVPMVPMLLVRPLAGVDAMGAADPR